MMDNLREYCVNAKKITNKQEPYFTGPLGNDIFQYQRKQKASLGS